MKTEARSLVDEVNAELEKERRQEEEQKKKKEAERKESLERQYKELEESRAKIIPNLLDMISDDPKFETVLANPKHYYAIRTSGSAESVHKMFSKIRFPGARKSYWEKMTEKEREENKRQNRLARAKRSAYARKYKLLHNLFEKAHAGTDSVTNSFSPKEPSGGVGIRLASWRTTERKVGRLNHEEYDGEAFYHIMLVLDRDEFKIQVFKPGFDQDGSEYWGKPLVPYGIPQAVDKILKSLASGGKQMVSTIMRSRLDSEKSD